MNWKSYSYVVGSEHRRKAILNLDVPRTPSQIARKTGINTSHVSKVLKELERKYLVECLVPKQKVGRVYTTTKKGKEILKYLKKAEEGIEDIKAKK